MKRCSKCKKEKLDSEFNFKNKALNIKHSECKKCTRLFVKNHYNKNKAYYLDKTRKRNNLLRSDIFNYIKQYLLDNPCIDCGESDIVVLEFDHKGGDFIKIDAVSKLIRHRISIDKIKEEIEKCDVRCANCHRRKTAKDFGSYRL